MEQAAASPAQLHAAAELYRGEKYIMLYRRDTNKAYVVLRSGAQTADYVKAAYSAHVLLYLADSGMHSTSTPPASPSPSPPLSWLHSCPWQTQVAAGPPQQHPPLTLPLMAAQLSLADSGSSRPSPAASPPHPASHA